MIVQNRYKDDRNNIEKKIYEDDRERLKKRSEEVLPSADTVLPDLLPLFRCVVGALHVGIVAAAVCCGEF